MILDRGTCKIYRKTSTTPAGGKPTSTEAAFFESYYGELSFETAPSRPTERREETKTAARIRILQNRNIRDDDVAETMVKLLFGSKNAKAIIEIPQRIYPREINIFLFPILSDNAPTNNVVIVAATALNAVINGMKS